MKTAPLKGFGSMNLFDDDDDDDDDDDKTTKGCF
jgi:hypothetical protein